MLRWAIRMLIRLGDGLDVLAPLRCREFLGYGAAQESNLPSLGLPSLTGF
jgi:hypothetical protein